ncbi:MAG: DUF4347 domain-containing protein [Methylococcales bacterium]|nr:DUF4347 domain-containing protein [Methylococcales bacterium]MDD5753756.1 DUF4347 domain-containing protein [Methylococcales bacterium]
MTTQRNEILFIDANVTDAQSLIASISPNVEVILLDDKTNVINQIAAALDGQKNLDAIHIISHGAAGELAFANGSLNNANLVDYTTQLKRIGSALSANGDLLLYGCDIAKGDAGLAFINQLSVLTDADVAASDDLTGNSFAGADWILESTVGSVEADALVKRDVVGFEGNTLAVTPVTFATQTTVTISGSQPRFVNVGDFNADGNTDLVTANENSGDVSVLLGNGQGNFGTSTSFKVGFYPDCVISGDFNSDGKIDLVTANELSNDVSVLLGDGNGGFGIHKDFSVGSYPYAVTTGDFNGDGNLDLATPNRTWGKINGTVSVLLGDGRGGFGPQTTFTVGMDPRSINVGDFNADGKVDLVTANGESHDVSVLLGDGHGGFGNAISFAVGSSENPSAIIVSDFNADGKKDLATANWGSEAKSISVLLGNGSGFGSATIFAGGWASSSIVAGDFNFDGKMDLAMGSSLANVTVLLGDGQGGFSSPAYFDVGQFPDYSVNVADLNNDGKTDIVAAIYDSLSGSSHDSHKLSVLFNTTTLNHAPIIPTVQITPAVGTENTSYQIRKSDLLYGFYDADGDTLSITNLTATNGTLTEQFDSWIFTPNLNYSGSVALNYNVTDGKVGGLVAAPTVNLYFQPAPTYSITVDRTSVKEGETAILNLQTTNVAANTAVPFTFSGNANAADVNGGIPTTFIIGADGKASVPLTFLDDKLVEGTENLTFALVNDASKFASVTINDQPPTYALTLDKNSVKEGETAILNLQTTNVAANTAVPFTFSGNANAADVNGGIPTTFIIGADGKATLPLNFLNDKLQEGNENLTFTLANDATKFVTVNVNDLPPTYALSVDKTSVNEGETATLTLQTTNVAANTSVAFTYSGSATAADVSGGIPSSFTVGTDGKASLPLPFLNDKLRESTENLILTLLADATKTATISVINDTSVPDPTYSLSVDKNTLNEGETATLSLQTTNVAVNTAVNFTYSGTATAADLTSGFIPTSLTVGTDGKATIPVKFLNDHLTEGTEYLTFTLANDVTKSATINIINDTSKNNHLPTGELVINGIATVGEVLSVQNNLQDVDGLGVMSYQWLNNDVAIVGENKETYTLIENDAGKGIRVKASYTDLQGTAESVVSSPIAINEQKPPTGNVTITGIAKQNQTLTATNTLDDVNKPMTKISYQWLSDGTDISGKTQNTYALTQIDVKKTISVRASYTDGLNNLESVTSSPTVAVVNVNGLPKGKLTISGIVKEGQILKAVSNSITDEDGLGTFKYQWLSDGKNISNANKDSYKPSSIDFGKKISVKVSYMDGFGALENVISAETAPIGFDGVIKTAPSNANALLIGSAKNDLLTGLAGADTLRGDAGNDSLNGGFGNDSLEGGNGNDTLMGNDGNDTLIAGSGDDKLDGGKGKDTLDGGDGKDTLDGGGGVDNMAGGDGDDVYFVENSKDVVIEKNVNITTGGKDTVTSTSSYTLGENIENLILKDDQGKGFNGTGNKSNNVITGSIGDDVLKGMAGNDTLIGSEGADTLDGGLGKDSLVGGNGNDVYYMNNDGDTIVEKVDGGEQDEIISSVSFNLNQSENVEFLELSGTKAIEGNGNNLNNLLQEREGGKTNNIFIGNGGNDTINGQGGNDTLEGGDGNDELNGGDGIDVAVFSGIYTDYLITINSDAEGVAQLTLEYSNTENTGILDGIDTLNDIEILEFADGDRHNKADVLNDIGVAKNDSSSMILLTGAIS